MAQKISRIKYKHPHTHKPTVIQKGITKKWYFRLFLFYFLNFPIMIAYLFLNKEKKFERKI